MRTVVLAGSVVDDTPTRVQTSLQVARGAWVHHLEEQGLKAEKVVIFLVDEPRERSQDEVIVAWAAAIRAANLGILIFEDPAYDNPANGDQRSRSVIPFGRMVMMPPPVSMELVCFATDDGLPQVP